MWFFIVFISLYFSCEDVYLYGVFDGHSGVHVADFVRQRLPVELLFGQLVGVEDDFTVKKILQQAFLTVEAAFFETIDSALAEKIKLKLQLPEVNAPSLTEKRKLGTVV